MEALVVLLVLAVGGGGLALVVLLAGLVGLALYSSESAQRLQRQLGALERRLARLEAAAAEPEVSVASAAVAQETPEAAAAPETVDTAETPAAPAPAAARVPPRPPRRAPRPAPRPARPPSGPTLPRFTMPSPERVVVWLAAGLGGLALLLGALFALIVVFDRGWLGPSARVAMGLSGGTGIWLVATLLRVRGFRGLPSALAGAAMGILYGSLWAAGGYYGFFPPLVTFGLMCAVTAVAMASAVRHRDRFTAHLGVVGGLLTPILVSTGHNDPVGLFGYLALLSAGAAFAAVWRRWWDLPVTAWLGAMLLHMGWTVSWYAADQVPAAVIGAVVLAVPWAVAAATSRSTPVRWTTLVGALVPALVLLPWVVPVDAVFNDPNSGLRVVAALGNAVWWASGAAALSLAPAWLAARRVRYGSIAPGLAGIPLLVVFAFVWGVVFDQPQALPVTAGLVGALGVGVVATLRSEHARWGATLLPVVVGLALALLTVRLGGELPGGMLFAGVAGLTVLGALLARFGPNEVSWPSTLAGVGLIGVAAGVQSAAIGPAWVAAAAVFAWGVFATVPLLTRWRLSGVAWATAAVSGVVLFPALYGSWDAAWGDGWIGLVAIAVGGVALLSAAVLVRAWGATVSSPWLALFVAVALLGVSAAIPLELNEQWLTVAWALEAAALAALSRRLTHPLVWWGAVLLAVTVAVRLLLNPWAFGYGDGGWPILNWTLYTWGVPALCLLATARLLPKRDPLTAFVPPVIVLLAIGVGFALINVEVTHLFRDALPPELGGSALMQGMVRSLAWAGYGMAVLLAGLGRGSRTVRFVGFAFVLLAAAKVFGWDLFWLEGFVRVGSVLGLGVSLLLAAFLFERLVIRRTRADPA